MRIAMVAALVVGLLVVPVSEPALAVVCDRTFTGRVPLPDLTPGQTHLGAPGGKQKVSTMLNAFFRTDPTATPWFLA